MSHEHSNSTPVASKGFIHANGLKESLDTGVKFPSFRAWVLAQETSSKSVNPTTYDRYEKYHSPYDNRSLMARFFDKIYNPMKPLLRKIKIYND